MTPFLEKRLSPKSLLLAAILLSTAVAGCGEDFENAPRTPVPIELTGVIKPERVTVSPRRIGAGPISITISNQTAQARTVTLKGNGVSERVGPVNPQDTATIQKTVVQGTYEVTAASEEGAADVIRPATLRVGRPRPASNDRLLLP